MVASQAAINNAAKEAFAGMELPDPNIIIPRWHSNSEVQEMNRFIVEFANSKEVPSDKLFNQITEHILLNELTKNGFRGQIWQHFTIGEFWTGIGKDYAAYPYKPLHKMKDVDPEKIKSNLVTGPDGEKEYQRESPWSKDPNDPDDVMNHTDSDLWTLMKVKCCEVTFTKNSKNLPQFIALSHYGAALFKVYEEIRARKCQSIGVDPNDLSRPFLLNAKYVI